MEKVRNQGDGIIILRDRISSSTNFIFTVSYPNTIVHDGSRILYFLTKSRGKYGENAYKPEGLWKSGVCFGNGCFWA